MDDCTEWTGYTQRTGYGIVQRNKKRYLVHRWLYEQAFGPIPPGLVVMHKCDNPKCVNLEHLKLGTQKENMEDAGQKGRMRGNGHEYTEDTIDQILFLRDLHYSYTEIAEELGLPRGSVATVVQRRGR